MGFRSGPKDPAGDDDTEHSTEHMEHPMTPIRNIAAGAVAALALVALAAGPVAACGPEEAMTHFGVVASIDPAAGTLTIVDAGTGGLITFQATPEQLAGLVAQDHVSIHYAKVDDALVAEEIEA